MNHYTLAEMTPGLSEEFTVTVTPEMMDAFRAITGDVSPIHIDADYARGRGFPGRVVYGMLGASFFSTLAAGSFTACWVPASFRHWQAFTCPESIACSTALSVNLPSPSSSGTR